jgi:signal transduction histidine kinase
MILAALGLSVLPAGVAWLLGGAVPAVASFALTASVAGCLIAGLCRHLRTKVIAPHEEMTRALERLRAGKPMGTLEESGVPLLDDLRRQMLLAGSSIENRVNQSMARALSLEAAFEHVHSVIQSLTEGVLVLDRDNQLVLNNPAGGRWLADTGGSSSGRPVVDLLSGDLSMVVRGGLEYLADVAENEYRCYGVPAGERILDVAVARVRSSGDSTRMGVVVVLVDVTQNYEVTRLKNVFLSTVSHELRTPITNICSFIELLGEVSAEDDPSVREEFLGILFKESQRMQHLIDDLLEYSGLEVGDVTVEAEEFDLVDLLRETGEVFVGEAGKRGITLNTVEAAEPMLARTDRRQLRQVLHRVLDNALKFTPEGGEVRLRSRATDDGFEITVADSGPGVAREHREAIFDSFAQLGDLLTEKPDGTGLGLPICRKLTRVLGGRIWCAESDLGGASLHIRIPLQPPTREIVAAKGGVAVAVGAPDDS